MNTDISLLLEASKIISSNTSSEAAIAALLQLVGQVNKLSRARVLIPDNNNILGIKYAYGLSQNEMERGKYSLGEGITGQVMATGNIALIPDIREEPSFLNKMEELSKFSNQRISYIAVPILKDGIPVGVLAAYREQADDDTLHNNIIVLQILATMINMSLEIESLLKEKTTRLKAENTELRKALMDNSISLDIIGQSTALKTAIKTALQAAASDATVMLFGESGTGKEKFARMIHLSSPLKDKPFITVNCAAIPENLLESELFGHVKGSFTGATSNKIGKFEAANNGTIFLDEIGDMQFDLQAKLLRTLQENTIQRVGSTEETPINVRVITATHKNIQEAVNKGKFRLDLFYRLNVLPINLPPLRERIEDIKILTLFFLNRANQRHKKNIVFSEEIFQTFKRQHWSGNIRQLENIVERIVILSENRLLSQADIEGFIRSEQFVEPSANDDLPKNFMFSRPYAKVKTNEKDKIIGALRNSGGNKTQAALNLGMTPRQLHYRIEKLEIEL